MIDKWHREGSYVPYPEDQLFELILAVKVKVHPWIRLNRVIRDIPNQYITGGCSVTNMRQVRKSRHHGEACGVTVDLVVAYSSWDRDKGPGYWTYRDRPLLLCGR